MEFRLISISSTMDGRSASGAEADGRKPKLTTDGRKKKQADIESRAANEEVASTVPVGTYRT